MKKTKQIQGTVQYQQETYIQIQSEPEWQWIDWVWCLWENIGLLSITKGHSELADNNNNNNNNNNKNILALV